MTMKISRREVLGFAGGAVAGIALTPAPWKLVDDIAIWTQNWRWIPVPPHGPVTTRNTVCALCPAACPVRVRCVGGSPVSLESATDSSGLCPLGIGGHHLRFHPARVDRVVRLVHHGEGSRTVPVPFESVVNEIARGFTSAANRGDTVAVLDTRPDRSVSWAWRRMLGAIPTAVMIAAPCRESESRGTLARMLGRDADLLGLDLAHARTIVSFGTPLLEGWGSRETFVRLARKSRDVRLVHVGALGSETAEHADRWLAARPGSEAALALGIAHVLIAEGLIDPAVASRCRDFAAYDEIVKRFPPERVATITGVPARAVVATAREMTRFAPTIVLAGEDPAGGRFDRTTETAILGLNLLLGAIERPGGIVARAALPMPFEDSPLAPVRELDQVDRGAISTLIVDACAGDVPVPWPAIRRKLRKGAMVVALSPYLAGIAARADRVIPTRPVLEAIQELPATFDSPVAKLAIAAPIVESARGGIDPVDIVRSVSSAIGIEGPEWATSEELIRARVGRIWESGEGRVIRLEDGAATVCNLSDVASSGDLWDALISGATWEGDPRRCDPGAMSLLGDSADALVEVAADPAVRLDRRYPLTLVLRAPRDAVASPVVSPLVTKLYQESGLRRRAGTVAINPETARELGLTRGARARLETRVGVAKVRIELDHGVMPDLVALEIGPDAAAMGIGTRGDTRVADLVCGEGDCWRTTAARLEEA